MLQGITYMLNTLFLFNVCMYVMYDLASVKLQCKRESCEIRSRSSREKIIQNVRKIYVLTIFIGKNR